MNFITSSVMQMKTVLHVDCTYIFTTQVPVIKDSSFEEEFVVLALSEVVCQTDVCF